MKPKLYLILTIIIGLVWFLNGLFCKILMLVPRHSEIVAEVLGSDHAFLLTRVIGFGEVALAVWIWSGIRSRWAAILQMTLVATMNIVEFFLANDLLLWGSLNSLFATMFILLVGWHEFWLKPRVLGDQTQ